MRCVILQPSYIPWRGYFHQIQKADLFIFYDDVQFDRRGWRNRNRVKTSSGVQWLTVPVNSSASSGVQWNELQIRDVTINWDTPWNRKHLETLARSYWRSPHYKRYETMLERFYSQQTEKLADLTIGMTIELARELGIEGTQFLRSSTLGAERSKTDRLIDLLSKVGATHYISGPSACDYLDEAAFASAGIALEFMSYRYPEYEQLHPPYDPQVSVLDLLMMKGPDAGRYIW